MCDAVSQGRKDSMKLGRLRVQSSEAGRDLVISPVTRPGRLPRSNDWIIEERASPEHLGNGVSVRLEEALIAPTLVLKD